MQLHGLRSICTPQRKGRSLALLVMIFATCFTQSLRAEAICAEVVMEIPQRVSMERQAFNAKLGINNGISDSVTELVVDIVAKDDAGNTVVVSSDPSNTEAKFFVREDGASNATSSTNGWSISGDTKAELRWLLIPAAGAGGTTAQGKVYGVGATVRFKQAGVLRELYIVPDTILVEPQPFLEIDYFLPKDVYGDDPFTSVPETPTPFPLGVLVRNIGAGPTRRTQIESAQPRITDNQQGLAISFNILSAVVGNATVMPNLSLDFGNIPPASAKVGRWEMTSSLDGSFVDFTAEFTHADALGGELTSLVSQVRTHTLLKDVLNNRQGRDTIRDFLAQDGDTVRLYESDGTTAAVPNRSDTATVQMGQGSVLVNMGATSILPSYARVLDPNRGQFRIATVTRQDGQQLSPENFWASKVREGDSSEYTFYLHIFDPLGATNYVVVPRTDDRASLVGDVFRDLNDNGVKEQNEPLIAGAPIRLTGIDISGAEVDKTIRTPATGSFNFLSLTRGTYALAIAEMPGLRDGVTTAGTAGGTVTPGRVQNILLGNGANATGYRFAKLNTSATPLSELALSVDSLTPTVPLGQSLNVQLRVINNGPDQAAGSVVLSVPAGLTLLNPTPQTGTYDEAQRRWTFPTLATPNETSLQFLLRADVTGPQTLSATLSTTVTDPLATNNSVSLLINGTTPLDFGDLPDSASGNGAGNYETLLANNGPRHVLVPGLRFGDASDGEADAIQNVEANGDGADEDGLRDASIALGEIPSFELAVENRSGVEAGVCGYIDLNNDGDFSDTAEQAFAEVPNNTTPATLTRLMFPQGARIPLAGLPSTARYLRLRLSGDYRELTQCVADRGIGLPNGTGNDSGEVEDYRLTQHAVDYGDLPDSGNGIGPSNYESLIENDGPRHIVVPGLFLGTGIDGDGNALPRSTGLGDDSGDGNDDENGFAAVVSVTPNLSCGETQLVFNATAPATRAASILGMVDRNGDGDFADVGEFGRVDFTGTGQSQRLNVTLPARPIPCLANMAPGGIVAIRARLAFSEDIPASRSSNAILAANGLFNSGEVEDYNTADPSTVPVTISYVEIKDVAGTLQIDFNTASEAGTLGYRLLADIGPDNSATRVEVASIASKEIDSLKEQRYSVQARNPGATQFWIEEYSIDGKSTLYGPYQLGRNVGEKGLAQAINWNAINAEQSQFRARQQQRNSNTGFAEIKVTEASYLEYSAAALTSAGINLQGATASDISVQRGSAQVPVKVTMAGSNISSIGFFADAKPSLYSKTHLYRIRRGKGLSLADAALQPVQGGVVSEVSERRFEDNRVYSFSAPELGDPWFMLRALRNASTDSASWNFALPDYALASHESIQLDYWGGLDYAGEAADHSVQFLLNGTAIATDRFDGLSAHTKLVALPQGLLRAGNNSLTIKLLNDTGFAADVVNLEGFSVRYARTLNVASGRLDLPIRESQSSERIFADGFGDAIPSSGTNSAIYQFTGITSPSVVLQERGGLVTLLKSTQSDVSLPLTLRSGDRLRVLPKLAPALSVAAESAEPVAQNASYLIISHPSFIDGLGAFAAAKRSQGFSVNVVDVEAIYRYYSAGEAKPEAIQLAIKTAVARGATHVLLVGGDTYDYLNNLGLNSVSFIPTNYRKTSKFINFAPSDAVYADTDFDGKPNVALGRWPVRTMAELNAIVNKTLAYQNRNRALLLSDRTLGGERYGDFVPLQSQALGANWNIKAISLDSYQDGQTAMARADLVRAMQQDVSFLSYYGHSAPASWSREGWVSASLVNGGLFASVPQSFQTVQFGCWATYFVEPTSNTIAHGLLSQTKGAVSVLGATALTEAKSDTGFGTAIMSKIGTRSLGEVLRDAQIELSAQEGSADVVLGGVLLGDPSLQ